MTRLQPQTVLVSILGAALCGLGLAATRLVAEPIRIADLTLSDVLRFDTGANASVRAREVRAGEFGDTGSPPCVYRDQPVPMVVLPSDDDAFWSDEFSGSVAGLNGTVWVLTSYQMGLVAGGDFTEADGIPVARIARWDGSEWLPLGAGMDGPVFALAEFGGELIAGGSFTCADGVPAANIARWNGSEWRPLGTGVDNAVRALQVFEGSLIVGGDFGLAGDHAARQVARWDGTAWSPVGNGFAGGYAGLGVRALTVHDGDLVAGGFFTLADGKPVNHIARWDGTTWSVVGTWLDDTVYSLTTFDGHLVAGSVVWRPDLGTWGNMIARLEGATWVALGSGPLSAPFPNAVRSFATFGDRLIAVGQFPRAGGTLVNYVAQWDGQGWQPLQLGVDAPVYAATVYEDRLVVGGEFTAMGSLNHVASWDGTAWSGLSGKRAGNGLDGTVWALASKGDGLFAGGDFTYAGGVAANHIARWDGNTWSTLGVGMDGTVFAIAQYQDQIVAGGWFSSAGGEPAGSIARWDGQAWLPLGTGLNGPLRAMVVYKDTLIVGGDFTRAGNVSARNVAAWDGSSWRALGAGLTGGGGYGVRSLEVRANELVAGGFFTRAGDVDARFVASWNGQQWQAIGDGLAGVGYSLIVFRDRLVAGSVVWHNPSEGTWADIIRSWDGAFWDPLGDGPLDYPFPNAGRGLTTYRGDLIAAGQFPTAAGLRVNYVARWDGSSWSALGSGLDRPAYVAVNHQGSLFVGGEFTTAGGKPSRCIAQWKPVEGRSLESVTNSGLHVEAFVSDGIDVRYEVAWTSSSVRLAIYDVQGRCLRVLHQGPIEAGVHLATWDRRNRSGSRVARGIYFVRLEADGRAQSSKVVLAYD